MFKLRIGFSLCQYKLCVRSSASLIKTKNFSLSPLKVASSSLLTNHLLRSTSSVLIPSRAFWETFPASKRSFHAKDELDPDNYELVYRNKLFNYVFYGQSISLLALVSQIGYALYHGLNYFLFGKFVPAITQVGPFTVTYDLVALGILTVFTIQNGIVFLAAQKGLLRVYHKKDTDEYVFISLAANPFKTRKVVCKTGELKIRNVPNLMTAILGNFEVKDQRYYLRHEHFKNNYHYNRLVYEDY